MQCSNENKSKECIGVRPRTKNLSRIQCSSRCWSLTSNPLHLEGIWANQGRKGYVTVTKPRTSVARDNSKNLFSSQTTHPMFGSKDRSQGQGFNYQCNYLETKAGNSILTKGQKVEESSSDNKILYSKATLSLLLKFH